jgi:hypothetical protein
MQRSTVAFLAAGLVAPIAFAVAFYHKGALDEASYGVLIVVSAIISFSGVVFLGLPAYSFLRANQWTAFWIAPLMGAIVATVTWYAFNVLLALLSSSGWSHALSAVTDITVLQVVLWGIGPIGAVAGAVLWLIARPDRSTTGSNAGNTDKYPER